MYSYHRFFPTVKTRFVVILISTLLISSCSSVISGATKNFAAQLQNTISNHNDPEMVKAAIPAYMLLLESMLDSEDPNPDLLLAAADMYTAYSAAFVSDPSRQKKLSERGFNYAKAGWCELNSTLCNIEKAHFDEYKEMLANTDKDNVAAMFTFGAAWGNWIKSNSSDFNAVADIPKVTLLMRRIVELEETHRQGSAHLYLGIISSLLPPSVGGKPEVAKSHFEKAIALSNGNNLMVKVTFAQMYARLMFDRELHDKLLTDVVKADPQSDGLTLNNWMAKYQAEILLAEADEYF